MRNIEFKARLRDRDAAVRTALDLGAEDRGDLAQTDIYFHARSGRLKLRLTGDARGGQLVAYDREDQAAARRSDYDIAVVGDAEALESALRRALGVRCVVRKIRRLFLWKNIRLHIDRVEGLGDFLEFEAVVDSAGQEAQASTDLAELTERFGVRPEDMESHSYGDMMDGADAERHRSSAMREPRNCSGATA
ncbi:MAG: CYTH domain protein [candidate division BRC1 bacterium ADurb.BinA364]|nr:MAG: CYTH domain protein [candidate division BRC1 bacterium ADurb.BinA364]